MNFIDTLLDSDNTGVVEQLGQQFGLGSGQVGSVIRNLLPVFSHGLANGRQNASPLLQALQSNTHAPYLADPSTLQQPAATGQGNGLLSMLFGSKEVSSNVAQNTAQKTGIDSEKIKKMLPLVAMVVMAALKNHAQQQNMPLDAGANPSGLLGQLASVMHPGGGSGIGDELRSLFGQSPSAAA